MRPVEDFLQKRKSILNKTCIRHTKKREMPTNDQWDEFLDEIKTWSQPVRVLYMYL